MSHQYQGSPEGQDFKPTGNRPAQNARQATPGSVLSQNQFPGDGGAGDFLGLGDQVGGLEGHLMNSGAPAPAFEAPIHSAPASEQAYEEEDYEDELEPEEHEDHGDDDGVHSSWVDDTPPSKKSALPKLAVAVVLGMAGTAGFLALQRGAGSDGPDVAPLAPELNNTPAYRDNVFSSSRTTTAEAESDLDASGPEALADLAGESAAEVESPVDELESELTSAGDTASQLVADESAELELGLEEAESGVEGLALTARTDRVEPGRVEPGRFEPDLIDSEPVEPEPVEPELAGEVAVEVPRVEPGRADRTAPGASPLTASLVPAWQAVGETVPPGSGGGGREDGEPGGSGLVVLGDDAGDSAADSSSYWDELDTLAEEDGALAEEEGAQGDENELPDVVGSLTGWFEAEDEAESEVELATEVDEGGLVDGQGERAQVGEPAADGLGQRPVLVVDSRPAEPAPAPGTETATQSSGSATPVDVGSFGPALPAGTGAVNTVATEELGGTTTRVRRIDVQQVVDPDQRGPRRVTESELKGVWLKEEVPPMRAIQESSKVLTPQVGQVRVVLDKGELFQGRLYAMGEGRVWINNDSFGQMGLDGAKVVKIVRLAQDGSDPKDSGVEDLSGLESIRVKTPGGILVGKVVLRNEQQTTIVTDDGARVTLSSSDVQFLDDAPGVTLKRAGGTGKSPSTGGTGGEQQPGPAPESAPGQP